MPWHIAASIELGCDQFLDQQWDAAVPVVKLDSPAPGDRPRQTALGRVPTPPGPRGDPGGCAGLACAGRGVPGSGAAPGTGRPRRRGTYAATTTCSRWRSPAASPAHPRPLVLGATRWVVFLSVDRLPLSGPDKPISRGQATGRRHLPRASRRHGTAGPHLTTAFRHGASMIPNCSTSVLRRGSSTGVSKMSRSRS